MAEGERPQREVFLRGPRVRLRPLERGDLPRYQELFSDPELSMSYGGLGDWSAGGRKSVLAR